MADAPTSAGTYDPMLTVVPDPAAGDDGRPAGLQGSLLIDEIVREGARRKLAEALQAEVDAYIAQFAGERDEHGNDFYWIAETITAREVLESSDPLSEVAT